MDDHRLFAEAIQVTLADMGMTVVGIAGDAVEALEAARRTCPDLILVDLGLPDRSGLALGPELLALAPDAKIVAVTALADDRAIKEAYRAGFDGYVMKRIPADGFERALRAVAAGQTVFPHRAGVRARPGSGQAELLAGQLTEREVEVLQLLAEGRSGTEIARQLGISPNTVRTHVQGILTKLQVHSRLEAAAFAIRHDLVRVAS